MIYIISFSVLIIIIFLMLLINSPWSEYPTNYSGPLGTINLFKYEYGDEYKLESIENDFNIHTLTDNSKVILFKFNTFAKFLDFARQKAKWYNHDVLIYFNDEYLELVNNDNCELYGSERTVCFPCDSIRC